MATISLDDVSLTFTIRQNRNVTLKEFLLKRFFLESVNPKIAVHALSGINLTATDGDRVGVIGHNGAGKSTLLKLIAGIYPPTKGHRRVEGRICSLFDIALGFEHEATGRENITYRGYLQGESPRSLRAKIKDIEEFSDLGDFLTVPVRYYSAGMMVRLAFSIATASKPEILLIDEVLSVGDMAFQIKAKERMKQMMATARLMVVVSHDLASVEALCNRGMWLTHGGMVKEGPVREVVAAYKKSVSPGGSNPPIAPSPVGAVAA
jgi:ABC-type polysaccharide/polyol phosphate transport system ATPase subunit